MIMSRLPPELQENSFAGILQNVLKSKKIGKRSKKGESALVGLRQNNESLMNLLKNLAR